MTSLTFITDPLVTTMGAVRPAILLARELRKKGNRLTIITPRSDRGIARSLGMEGIEVKDVGPRFSLISSFPTLDAWARSLLKTKKLDRNDGVVVNTSSCIVAPAHVYYAQGLMTRTLTEILPANASIYGCIYALLKRPLVRLEQKLIHRFRDLSELFIANSRFCGSMYEEWGIKVNKIINPPVDCTFYKSSTRNPSEDYIITALGTFGKEGNFKLVKAIADAGACIKVFGDATHVSASMKKNPNIEFLGKVSDRELVQLYSNALFTLFAFSHEPFGYIPVESMACGTPVLTFDKQGPSETVIDRRTGWLANSNQELLALALYHWSKGYDSALRLACRERAMIFDTKWILRQWNSIIQEGLTGKSD
jgi:glycosyltransferase involved in cell wall biosynthesis